MFEKSDTDEIGSEFSAFPISSASAINAQIAVLVCRLRSNQKLPHQSGSSHLEPENSALTPSDYNTGILIDQSHY